jgi:hypothetical protein
MKGRYHVGALDVDYILRIFQMTFRSVGFGDVGLIHMTKDETQCRPFADTVMNFTFPQMFGFLE